MTKRSSPNRATLRATLRINPTRFVRNYDGVLTDEYDIGDLLGTGSHGDVYECFHRHSGHRRAVKVTPKSLDPGENQDTINEFSILRDLDHPNILKIYELLEDEENFYIISDVYNGGELFDHIADKGHLREDEAATLMLKILSTMNYCHKLNVVHKDLKPENILLDNRSNLNNMKIIDFGISQVSSSSINQQDGLTEVVGCPGTLCYMAPEILDGLVGPKSDVWACGVIAFTMLGGYTPFRGSEEEIIEQITFADVSFDYSVWDAVTNEAKEFILYLLNPDENSRPSAEEALNHPWLQHERQREKSQNDSFLVQATRSWLKNLQDFHAQTKLQQATCAFIACQLLTKEDRRTIDDVFRVLDENCDGLLDRHELLEGFRKYYGFSLTSQELDAIFARVDMDGTGCIDYSEFAVASIMKQKLLDVETLRNAFEMFDKDKSGYIDFLEIKKTLSLGSKWDSYIVEKIIHQVDEDRDGRISFEEFEEAMRMSTGPGPTCNSSKGTASTFNSSSEELSLMSDDHEIEV